MRKRKNKETFKKRLAGKLDIPEDIIFDVPRMTVFNNTEIRIENFKHVLEYEDCKISVACTEKFINVTGNELTIAIITDDEIGIKGKITTIEFS